MAKITDIIEIIDQVSTYKNHRENGKNFATSAALTGLETYAWSIAPGLMFGKMMLEIAPEIANVADTVYKNNNNIYEDELGLNGEIGNSNMRSNAMQQQIERKGMSSIRENQRSINEHFGDEARRFSRR